MIHLTTPDFDLYLLPSARERQPFQGMLIQGNEAYQVDTLESGHLHVMSAFGRTYQPQPELSTRVQLLLPRAALQRQDWLFGHPSLQGSGWMTSTLSLTCTNPTVINALSDQTLVSLSLFGDQSGDQPDLRHLTRVAHVPRLTSHNGHTTVHERDVLDLLRLGPLDAPPADQAYMQRYDDLLRHLLEVPDQGLQHMLRSAHQLWQVLTPYRMAALQKPRSAPVALPP